jgi:acetyl esterase/lipase
MNWTDLAAPLSFAWPAVETYYPHRGAVRMLEDLAYAEGGHPKRRLDLFLPLEGEAWPLVAFLHGGAWRAQDRRLWRWLSGLYSNVGVALARRGIAAAVVGYRQHPEVTGAGSAEDIRRALEWLAARSQDHGFRRDHVVLAGHSAGGHLAAALALALDGGAPIPGVRGVVSLGGFYDVRRMAAGLNERDGRALRAIFGGTDGSLAAWSPELAVKPGAPPLLLGVAALDPAPLRAEHAAMAEACRGAGAPVDAFEVPGAGHMGLVLQMGRRRDPISDRIARFARGAG